MPNYTVSQKRILTFCCNLDSIVRFYRSAEILYLELRQPKASLFSHFTQLVLLHYLAKHKKHENSIFHSNAASLLCQT